MNIGNVKSTTCDSNTVVSLAKEKSSESVPTQKKEETKQEEKNLEDIYFPSPPKIRFEGLDSTSPNAIIQNDEQEGEKNSSDTEMEASSDKLSETAAEEEEIIASDNDDVNNEMVNIGHGIEIKARYLNKCLIYGKTAKKLTRCLVDVLFPDVKLLANCSAFGQKSNVTKLTRAALPTRKVNAIIDYVQKRFADVSRSEIVLSINMKCKEARTISGREEAAANLRKNSLKRLLTKEEEELDKDASTSNEDSVKTKNPVTVSLLTKKKNPNVVCVQSSNKNINTAKPNIMRCNTQILIRPKPVATSDGTAAVISPITSVSKKPETVRTILSAGRPFGNLSKDGTKIVMPLEILKAASGATSQTNTTVSLPSPRPYIILGSSVSPVKQTSSVIQPLTVSSPSVVKK
ncbi:uncharacterized protein LOC118200026 [Stegodyphus dumicola]|uniref:uncharacterized protein LOC118200026 n=1 Tax=Stegodyphus dumicola TaxID=202533 RepID=UPI0015B14316|nr:uncharacterized protein LOC118200026 [Stegodyphus dumicola]